MWLILVLTFATAALAVWALTERFQATQGASELSGNRQITRGQHPLDQILAKLHLPVSRHEFLALTGIATLSVGAVVGLATRDFVTGLGLALVVPTFVTLELRRRLAQLKRHTLEQLPDTLMMLANSLKVGHSMIQAFQIMGEELPAPLGPEFARAVRDLQLGQSMEAALEAFKQRIGIMETDMLVQAILIQRETGGNLVEILNNLQLMLRERLKLQGKVVSLTAQGKLSGLVIGALPFGLLFFLWVANRPYLMEFMTHPLGLQVMLMAALGQVAGILMIRKIVNFPI